MQTQLPSTRRTNARTSETDTAQAVDQIDVKIPRASAYAAGDLFIHIAASGGISRYLKNPSDADLAETCLLHFLAKLKKDGFSAKKYLCGACHDSGTCQTCKGKKGYATPVFDDEFLSDEPVNEWIDCPECHGAGHCHCANHAS